MLKRMLDLNMNEKSKTIRSQLEQAKAKKNQNLHSTLK